jgi:hypothetical protein
VRLIGPGRLDVRHRLRPGTKVPRTTARGLDGLRCPRPGTMGPA